MANDLALFQRDVQQRDERQSTIARGQSGLLPLSITVIVLAKNEEIHLARCLGNVSGWAKHLIVIDSFSTDGTIEVARSFGADVRQRAFKNQADQFQWALDDCNIGTEWILRLDADEYLEEGLKAEIRERLPGFPPETTGVILKRKVIFRGKWIRNGGYYPTGFLRLWRNGAARIEQRWMDEHAILLFGQSVTFKHDFVDHNLRDITWWIEKHNRYATRQMVDFINLEHPLYRVEASGGGLQSSQTRLKRYLRNSVFRRAPLYLRGVLYFLFRYFIRLGFLDGRQGFVFHFLQGCWNWILVDAKIDEARSYIRKYGLEAFKVHLRDHHKIDF
jgi:glycosyltransferase involved in cell wall biosynthesis